MDDPPKVKPSPQLLIERWCPLVFGALTIAVTLFYKDCIVAKFNAGDWKLENLYGAIFNWSAIQTGFLFAVYGFVVGKTDGFIAAARGTQFMQRFIGYVKRANLMGFALTFY